MSTPTLSLLDQAELMQLALNASSSGDAASAIAYLKEAVSRPDSNAIAHFLLGAEYAQIKMFDRAAGEMEAAIAVDPALAIARFQLGLIWLSTGAAERSATVLEPLLELPEGEPLRAFARGLLHLMKDEFDAAAASLHAGMARNTDNPALNRDMQSIVDEIARLQSAAPADQPLKEAPAAEGGGLHMLLSAYTGNKQ